VLRSGIIAIWTVLAFANGAGAAEKIGYGSRVGMNLTIISANGLDTEQAEIHAIHDRKDAGIFCREYARDFSSKCVNEEMRSAPKSFVYRANCETGVFLSVGGRYRFVGPAKEDPDNMMIAYQVIDLGTGEDLDGSEASGYPLAMEVFKDLCPSKVPGDIWKQ